MARTTPDALRRKTVSSGALDMTLLSPELQIAGSHTGDPEYAP
jgi:hypothetical protein